MTLRQIKALELAAVSGGAHVLDSIQRLIDLLTGGDGPAPPALSPCV